MTSPEDIAARPAVLVTGGARRLGAAMARVFGAAGWHVVVHYRTSREEAESLAATLPSAETICFDLSDRSAIDAAVGDLSRRLPDWRALINCASLFQRDTAKAIDSRTFDAAMQANAAGPVALAQAFLHRAQTRADRRVINVLDQKLANMNPDFFSYTMAKAALGAATTMLAMAARGTPDRVYGLCPGAMLPSYDQKQEEHGVSGRMNLLRRLTDPDELAQTALFMAEGHLQSGETIYVDSGQHLLSQDRDVMFLARSDD